MKNKELILTVLAGKVIVRGCEWRSSLAKNKAVYEEVDGKQVKTDRVKLHVDHQVECDGLPFTFQEDIAEEILAKMTEEKYNNTPRPFAKGDRVILLCRSWSFSQNLKKYVGKGVLVSYTGE